MRTHIAATPFAVHVRQREMNADATGRKGELGDFCDAASLSSESSPSSPENRRSKSFGKKRGRKGIYARFGMCSGL